MKKLTTLYKRSVTNKISEWAIEVESNKYRPISGFTDGEKVVSSWTECQGKNLGKKNETNANEQALAEATALHRKRIEMGSFENINDIDTPVFFKPMLAHDWNDYKDKIKFPLSSQPKYDGVRCIIKSDGMWSRNGKQIVSAPHIFESLKPLFEENSDLILDGELYAEKDIADFNTIISCVRKTKPTLPDLMTSLKYIKYYIYDIPSYEDTFTKRIEAIHNLQLSECCVKVVTHVLSKIDEVDEMYKNYIKSGYEGQMLRLDTVYENKRSKYLLKHKDFKDEEFTIIGYEEGKGNLSSKIGKLKFKTKNGVEFDAAVNGSWEYLTELWNKRDELIGKEATVKYFEMTEDGSLRFPKVIEIRDYE
jgi:DNA ligase-1